jgi:hypothetical protein
VISCDFITVHVCEYGSTLVHFPKQIKVPAAFAFANSPEHPASQQVNYFFFFLPPFFDAFASASAAAFAAAASSLRARS